MINHPTKCKEVEQHLKFGQSQYVNMFRCTFEGESPEHIDMKFKLWKEYRLKGYDVYCEATFKNGKRADLIVVSEYEIWIVEVLVSEKIENIAHKQQHYPFKINPVKIK